MNNKTVTISIGNCDNKLTQEEWSTFVFWVKNEIESKHAIVHFFGGSASWDRFQNVTWVIEMREDSLQTLKDTLISIRKHYKQDSVAWTEGTTLFI